VAFTCTTTTAPADENGVSFWVPGFFGSLAATPQQPGWSLAWIYYHTDVSGSGNIAVSREITIGQFNPKLDASVNANVHGIADVGFVIPSYVFATPLFGGQVSAGLPMAYGNNDASLNATATGTLGPNSLREVHFTPARHNGLWRPASNVCRALECRRQQLYGLSDR
jgi:hypothetical protein